MLKVVVPNGEKKGDEVDGPSASDSHIYILYIYANVSFRKSPTS